MSQGDILPNRGTCTIEGCDRPLDCRGICKMHWKRAKKSGEFPPKKDMKQRRLDSFWAKVDKSEECWVWNGPRSSDGYGRVAFHGRNYKAGTGLVHRISWELANGPIPVGMLIDHICFNRSCLRLTHLRLATPKQNSEHLTGARSNNTSGIRGVYWHKASSKWSAVVQHGGRRFSAGYFSDIRDAEKAAIRKRNELFTHNNESSPELNLTPLTTRPPEHSSYSLADHLMRTQNGDAA